MPRFPSSLAVASGAAAAILVTLAQPTSAAPPQSAPEPAGWQSKLVTVGPDGKLTYAVDAERNRIPDFSWAGYANGARPLPDVPVAVTVGPGEGDDTAAVQAALDAVGRRPADPSGRRGAVLLRPGTYEIGGTLAVRTSGVVLRGSGDGADPATATVLRAVGNSPAGRTVIVAGGGGGGSWSEQVPGTRTDITSDFVPVGARSFTVANAANLRVGDTVVLVHPCTAAWLAKVKKGEAGGAGWQPGQVPIIYNRHVTAIAGSTVTVDAPVFDSLDRSLSQSFLYKWSRAGLVTEVGVEDLRVDIVSAGGTDENHAAHGIALRQVEDGWVRGVTVRGFTKFGVLTRGATRVTVTDSQAVDPVSQVTGGRRYNFGVEPFSQQILFQRLVATGGRHAYVSNGGATASGVVFHEVRAQGSFSPSEGHRLWSQGLLYDNFTDRTPRGFVLGLYNRGDMGTKHGWGAVQSVIWNSTANVLVEKPPGAQNYAVGVTGKIAGSGPFKKAPGYVEGTNTPGLVPASLYQAQLRDRLGSHA